MPQLNPMSIDDLLKAHRLMMQDLVPENGRFRSGSIGVFKGNELIHLAPPARLVPEQVHNLFAWYQQSGLPPLVKSAVFHCEFEFIHPFADGNGRMGRMWHSLLLGRWWELFFWLPVEELILARRQSYYAALNTADSLADSTAFVEFMLETIRSSLEEAAAGCSADQDTDQDTDQDANQVSDQAKTPAERLLSALGDKTLSAAELMARLGLSHRQTFRQNYLNPALEQGLVERTLPDKPSSRYQKYKRCGTASAVQP